MPGVAHAAESLSLGGWVLLLAYILMTAQKEGRNPAPMPGCLRRLAALVAAAALVNDLRFVWSASAPAAIYAFADFAPVSVAVCGLLLIENLFRNTSPARRWHVYPFCIAIGFIFAYNLFAFCEAVVLKSVDPLLLGGRGVVLALMVPLLALTMARNAEWQIDLHVSRKVVFHGATLSAAGLFILLAAGVRV